MREFFIFVRSTNVQEKHSTNDRAHKFRGPEFVHRILYQKKPKQAQQHCVFSIMLPNAYLVRVRRVKRPPPTFASHRSGTSVSPKLPPEVSSRHDELACSIAFCPQKTEHTDTGRTYRFFCQEFSKRTFTTTFTTSSPFRSLHPYSPPPSECPPRRSPPVKANIDFDWIRNHVRGTPQQQLEWRKMYPVPLDAQELRCKVYCFDVYRTWAFFCATCAFFLSKDDADLENAGDDMCDHFLSPIHKERANKSKMQLRDDQIAGNVVSRVELSHVPSVIVDALSDEAQSIPVRRDRTSCLLSVIADAHQTPVSFTAWARRSLSAVQGLQNSQAKMEAISRELIFELNRRWTWGDIASHNYDGVG